jgi:hypothetical protein
VSRGVACSNAAAQCPTTASLVTQNIRQSAVADDSLSTMNKNGTIITVDGAVTLHGPVKREKEE